MRRSVRDRRVAPAATLVAALLLLSAAVACASAARTRDTDGGDGTLPNLITADEIAGTHATNAYDAIAALRHNFLSDRGKTSILNGGSPSLPNVYVDGMPYGTLSSLHGIAAGDVLTIRLYRAWEATTKYGTGNPAGVIEVTTKRQ